MSVYKRGEYWWIQFTAPNKEKIRRSSGTKIKKEAEELHDKLKAESWRVKNLGAKPRHTWKEAVIKWIEEMGHKKSIETDLVHLRWLDTLLNDTALSDINKGVIDKIKTAKLKEGVSNSTVNRILSLVRAILNKAVKEWEWLDTAPTVRMLPEPKGRIRWLTHEEVARLLAELPKHLNLMARFALATGLREANVTHLEWSQVDLSRSTAWINAEDSKSGRAIAVPLSDDAMAVLRECHLMRDVVGIHVKRVFTYKGNPVNDANTKAFRHALVRASIEDFRWHDLRHCWASFHVQSGTPLNVLKELGGWSDLGMVMRYAHLSSEHLSEYANNSAVKLAVNFNDEKAG